MTSRAEVTTRYARSFRAADKRTKGRILDEVVSVTGWSRDNARRRLTSAAQSPPGAGRSVTTRPRKQRATKFSYDALKVLQRVWAASGGQCGKYLAASMRMQLDGLERHGELVDGVGRYSMAVRAELLAMSAASIDRYLRPAKATDQIRGVSTTKPSPLLRSSIKIRKAGDEVEAEPGFFEGDTVAHCGPTLKGEFARTEVVKLDEASGSDCQAAGSSFRGSLIQADAGSSRIFGSWVVANLVGCCCRAASRVWERCRAVSPARP